MDTVVERARNVVTPIIESLGYEVVEITYGKSYGENNLTVYVFKKGGITFADCEKINDALDGALDAEDITDGASYNLNISSPGLDRPVKSEDDYRRSLDTDLEFIFKKPLGKKKKVHGILLSYDENSVNVDIKGKPTVLEKSNFETVRPYIKF